MSQSTLRFLQNEFPYFDEAYFECIMTGIASLSQSIENQEEAGLVESLRGETDSNWHRYFDRREVYYRAILKIWPSIKLFEVQRKMISAGVLDDYLDIYLETQFGFFFSNTKALIMGYNELNSEWDTCYDSWIKGNLRILSPYADLIDNNLNQALRKTVNDIIVSPNKYQSNLADFRRLVKRQYKLALTEQNC